MHESELIISIFAIFAIFIALPWMVLSFLSRKREQTVVAAGDPQLNATLTSLAEKLEKRLDAIEGLLDHEVPGWRRNQNDK